MNVCMYICRYVYECVFVCVCMNIQANPDIRDPDMRESFLLSQIRACVNVYKIDQTRI